MPDLNELLQSAADAVTPSPLPPFVIVERRYRRRRFRRTGLLVGVVALLTGGVVGLVSRSSGHREVRPATPQPCVARTDQNSRDTFVAIPSSGVTHIDMQVESIITVGWRTCGERGDLELSVRDPKHLLLGAPDSGSPVESTDVSSARYMAFHTGTVTLTGHGSLGSTGALEITIGQITEPGGASDPSPYPGRTGNEGVPDLCLTPDAVDSDGRVTQSVGFNTATLAPAPGAASDFTAAQILGRFAAAQGSKGLEGHPKAYFGALTDNNTNPFPQSRPLWVVVVCDAPFFEGSGGPGGRTAPAPGTSPSPGGQILGMVSVPFDEKGRALGESFTGYADKALLTEELFEVPFARDHHDASDGRQIGLTYRSDDACSAFDHLDAQEPGDGTVYVRVWLRLIGDHKSCTGTGDTHSVIVGLREPLAERPLLRGVPPR